MIEAIPTSRDSIVLVITKVDNPEEFDEKFSRFGLQNESFEEDEDYYETEEDNESEDSSVVDSPEIVNCFEQLHELIEEAEAKGKNDGSQFIPLSEALQNGKKKKQKKKKEITLSDKVKVFSFLSMNPVIEVAHLVTDNYNGKNTLWKDETTSRYYLVMNRGNKKSSFLSACAVISEYGREESITYATQDYFNEHYQIIIKDRALHQLAML